MDSKTQTNEAQTKVAGKGMMMLPAAPGLCAMCATNHREREAHNFWSIFYQLRFRMKYGRDATHADTIAHLSADDRRLWREALQYFKRTWSEPDEGEPISEPYCTN